MPVIATTVAAPAFAVSKPKCGGVEAPTYTMYFGDQPLSTNQSGTVFNATMDTIQPAGLSVDLTGVSVTSSGTISVRSTGLGLNAKVVSSAANWGGGLYPANTGYFALDQGGTRTNNDGSLRGFQTAVFTFNQTLYNVQVTVIDIDSQYDTASDKYADQVQVTGSTGTTSTATVANSTYLVGAGTNTVGVNPSQYATATNPDAIGFGSTKGNATFTISGGTTTITVKYSNKQTGNGTGANTGAQQIYLAPFTFSLVDCVP